MRYCGKVERLCDRLIISAAVTFADGTLTVNLPAGAYAAGCQYCIIVGQTIPAATTITAPVVITIGDGTEEYPLVDGCCAPVTACSLRTRTKYPVRVVTTATGGTFKLLARAACAPTNNLLALDGTAPVADGGGAGA